VEKPFWSAIQTFLTGCAAVILSGCILLIFLMKPLWQEIYNFLGIHFNLMPIFLIVSAVVLMWAVWLLLWVIVWKSPITSAWSIIGSILICAVWGLIIYYLMRESTTSLPSILPLTRFYIYMGLFLLLAAAIFAICYRSVRTLPELLLAILCVAGSAYLDFNAFQAFRQDQARWPAVTLKDHSGWKASWITPGGSILPGNSPANSWYTFRKKFSVDTMPAKAEARVAADTYYWLWLNEKLVVREGGLKRGPNPYDSYYDTVDLTPYLIKGENTLVIQVWHLGRDGFSHKDSGKAGLIFDLQTPQLSILSDDSWKAQKNPAYGNTLDPVPNYRLAESNVNYDARNQVTGWEKADFNDFSWAKAKKAGLPPTAPWHNLVARPIPMWQDGELLDYVKVDTINGSSGSKVIRAYLPVNQQVYPYIKVSAPSGAIIDIRTDAYSSGGIESVRAEYITTTGEQEFEVPIWMNGDVVEYSLPDRVDLVAVKYRPTGYNTSVKGTFSIDDLFLNNLHKKARQTLLVDMRDNFMDSANRERAQWWGDEMIELQEAGYTLDSSGLALAKKGILELAGWQQADGSLYSPIPAGNWTYEVPLQMLQAVYGIKQYYLLTGDAETIRTVYPAIRRYMALWQTGSDGLVIHRAGGWNWQEWGDEIDSAAFENAWYYLALKSQADLASAAGQSVEVPPIRERMDKLSAAFNQTFWTDNGYRSPASTGKTDDRVQAVAVVAGLAGEDKYPAILKVFQSEYHASPAMENFVFEALMKMGQPDSAFERLTKRYDPQVQSPHTTLWEGWTLDGEDTFNHAWAGGMLYLFPEYIAGVQPAQPGWDAFTVSPEMGKYTRVGVAVPTPHGLIEAHLRRSADLYGLKITVPQGTVGWAAIKKSDLELYPWVKSTLDGKGAKLDLAQQDDEMVYYRLTPGVWDLEFTPKK
jgi:hypothetical protein